MSKRTATENFIAGQEKVNASIREFNRRAARHLPVFRAQVQRFIDAVNRAAR